MIDEDKEEYRKDILWIIKCVNDTAPDIKFLEPTIQSLSLVYATKNETTLDQECLIKIALSGFIAMRCRIVDASRFSNIHPFLYYQVSQRLMEKDYKIGVDNEENFTKFIERLTK